MTAIIKSNSAELKQAMFIVMIPDDVDLHGDITSEEEVRKACFNFNQFCRQANLFHVSNTETFSFCESYVMPVDCNIEGIDIKKGTWVATIQVKDDNLWELIKSGECNGLSIGALASTEEINKE